MIFPLIFITALGLISFGATINDQQREVDELTFYERGADSAGFSATIAARSLRDAYYADPASFPAPGAGGYTVIDDVLVETHMPDGHSLPENIVMVMDSNGNFGARADPALAGSDPEIERRFNASMKDLSGTERFTSANPDDRTIIVGGPAPVDDDLGRGEAYDVVPFKPCDPAVCKVTGRFPRQ